MRDIFFRAKRKNGGLWVYGDLIHTKEADGEEMDEYKIFDGTVYNYGKYYTVEVKKETIGQYTGLKDENRKNIFEGDIIKSSEGIGCVAYGRFSDVQYGFHAVWTEEADPHQMLRKELYYWLNRAKGGAEVIGNIFDNPELLGEGYDWIKKFR